MQFNLKAHASNDIDSTAREIIQLLRLDGRMSFTKIAQRLDISETSVGVQGVHERGNAGSGQ